MSEFYALQPEQQVERLQALAEAALAQWGFGPCALRLVKFRENAVFAVTTGSGRRYALRVHRAGYHSDAALRSELQWMLALQASGFDVPQIVPARAGELFLAVRHPGVPESRQVDVFEWIDGRQLGNVGEDVAMDPAELARMFRTIGALAARLHNQASSWQRPADFIRHAWDMEGLVGERPLWGRFWDLAALSAGERTLVAQARARLQRDLQVLDKSAAVYGLVHADFAPENLLLDGERIRLLDFDDAGFGWHLFEIATSLYFYTDHAAYPLLREAAIAGYRSERALPEEQLAMLPMFLAARGFTYLGWVHTRQETRTARELTPMLIELACNAARGYLRQP